jgi:hypothetical protein
MLMPCQTLRSCRYILKLHTPLIVCVFAYACVRVRLWERKRDSPCINTYTQTHTYIHTCMHTLRKMWRMQAKLHMTTMLLHTASLLHTSLLVTYTDDNENVCQNIKVLLLHDYTKKFTTTWDVTYGSELHMVPYYYMRRCHHSAEGVTYAGKAAHDYYSVRCF